MENMERQLIESMSFSPASLEFPDSWVGHLPFAAWLMGQCRPDIFVELGTHSGNSYFSFCQAVKEHKLQTKCYAVDSWKGEEHAGNYGEDIFEKVNAHNQQHYAAFSKLMRMQFDDAASYFSEASIGLLHIDGFHTYEAVRHDFETWETKLISGAFVVFHDINVRERDFGVWKFWEEIKEKYPLHVEFLHSHGLGVMFTGKDDPRFPWMHPGGEAQKLVQLFFQSLGPRQFHEYNLLREQEKRVALEDEVQDCRTRISAQNEQIIEQLGRIAAQEQCVADLKTHLEEQAAAWNAEIEQLRGNYEAEIEQLRQLCNEVTHSRSWRITKPLRTLTQALRRKKKMSVLDRYWSRFLRIPEYAGALLRVVRRHGTAWPFALRKAWSIFRKHGAICLIQRLKILLKKERFRDDYCSLHEVHGEIRKRAENFTPKVSVIVPNYNHSQYLRQRLDCIYNQTYRHFDVILLDDRSTDESANILREYAEHHAERTTLLINETNSGGVFHQWKRGLNLADGELVWIAESDDYCSENFLEELVGCFQHQAVMLAFCRTDFVQGAPPERIWTSEEYLHDLKLDIWNASFIRSAQALVKMGWAVKNMIPNVSGAVFRTPRNLELFDDPEWMRLRLCGDWIFYLTVARGGLVAYTPHAVNYYRQHPLNTSVRSQREDIYFEEHEYVSRHIVKKYRVEKEDLLRQKEWLYRHWLEIHGGSKKDEFERLYNVQAILESARTRKPNLAMVVYALTAGGGETFPITLANALKKRGYAVTLFNFRRSPTEKGVRDMISPDIPLLETDNLKHVPCLFQDMGIEIAHSHHAWADTTLAILLDGLDIAHVVTMHGMYEMMTPEDFRAHLPILRQISGFVYISEKNLLHFPASFFLHKKKYRIDNALPVREIQPVAPASLDIPEDAFILCLVSRAIPEKGWEDAINAVTLANRSSSRDIHLLLIGDGPEYKRLRDSEPPGYVHLLGFRPNVRDYFALAHIGLLPTRFAGESAPLVLIECLLSGRPMFASNLGEIPYMLSTIEGPAGEIFTLDGWNIDVEALARAIVRAAEDSAWYESLLHRVPLAAEKFQLSSMVDRYEQVYGDVLALSRKPCPHAMHEQL